MFAPRANVIFLIKLEKTYFILRILFTGWLILLPFLLLAQQPTSSTPAKGTITTPPRQVPAITPRSANGLSTATVTGDSVVIDSVRRDSSATTAGSDLQTTVNYSAKDSTIFDATGQIVELYGDAQVLYGQISLKADYIKINWSTNEVYAKGRYDSTAKKMVGQPIFKDGADNYNTKEMRYNFKSKKGFIQGVVTAQGEGNIRGKTVKKDNEDNLYIRNAIYTTCNLAVPHFHINASKIKVVHNREIISGPFNLVINEIPTPIALPFGFFPIPKKNEIGTPGIIFPTYGEEPNGRGFYLRDGGYYLPVNEHLNFSFRGSVYANGSWGIGLSSEYLKRYRYGGSFAFTFARNRTTALVDRTQAPSNDFSLNWAHSPRPHGNSTFSANVNVSSNSYNQLNTSLLSSRYTSNAANSGVNYSRKFGQYVTSSANINVSQNFGQVNYTTNRREGGKTNISSGINLGVTQIAPFALKGGSGRWYETFRVGADFNAQFVVNNTRRTIDTTGLGFPVITNQVLRGDSLTRLRDSLAAVASGNIYNNTSNLILFNFQNLPDILRNAQFQSTYSIPITLPNFKIARYINFTPGVSLQGNLYMKSLNYSYNSARQAVQVDTAVGHLSATYFLSFNASLNTRVYGTYFVGLGRVQAIRHTFAPSISFSYTPDLSGAFLQTFQINEEGKTARLSRYRGLGGTAGSSTFTGRSGAISYSFVNQIEMKVRSRSDSAKSEFEKISLFDNISLSGSYNPYALRYNFSTLNLSANTQIFKKVSFNFSSAFDPYAYLDQQTATNLSYFADQPQYIQTGPLSRDLRYTRVNRLAITEKQGLAHLQSLNFYLSTQFKPKGSDKPKQDPNANTPAGQAELRDINLNPENYVDFNIPWSFNVGYTFSLSKITPRESAIIQALTLSGDLSLTPKWKVSVQSGFDVSARLPSLTTISVHRDLHCWDMNFSWTPYSGNRLRSNVYSFDLHVKSAILQDLKLSRRGGRGGYNTY